MRIESKRLLEVIHRPVTAVRLLEYFGQTFARQHFVSQVLEFSRSQSSDSGHIFPRTKNFVDLSERQQWNNIAYVMSALAVKIARLLLPNDRTTDNSIPTLLNAMSNNILFKRLTLPDENTAKKDRLIEQRIEQSLQSRVQLLTSVVRIRRCEALRVQLVSLLSSYPSTWV